MAKANLNRAEIQWKGLSPGSHLLGSIKYISDSALTNLHSFREMLGALQQKPFQKHICVGLPSFSTKSCDGPEVAVSLESLADTAKRTRSQKEGSKSSSWKMRAWYVQPSPARRLRAYVNRQQETGAGINISEVVDQAITAWLSQQGGQELHEICWIFWPLRQYSIFATVL